MKPKKYPYHGTKKELERPVQYNYPEEAFSDFVTKAMNILNPNKYEHLEIALRLMDSYKHYS